MAGQVVMAVAFLCLGIAVFVALGREDPDLSGGAEIQTTNTPRSDDLAEWACPSGTDGKVSCGFVSAPANYGDPEGPQVRIFVATIGVATETTGPPLVFLGEHFGQGTVDNFAEWRQIGRSLEREVILVDHRGSGFSEPNLSCLELGKVPWLEVDLGNDSELNAEREERRDALNRCSERLDALEDSPSFNFDTLLQDMDSIRAALSIDRWVVVASADTVPLAVAFEQRHPEAVDSLVLLRASAPDADRLAQRTQFAEEAVTAALGPSLRSVEAVRDALGERSVVFSTAVGGGRQRVSVSEGGVLPILAHAVAKQETRDGLAVLVERLGEGQWRELASLRGADFRTHDYPGLSLRLAVDCQLPTDVPVDDDPEDEPVDTGDDAAVGEAADGEAAAEEEDPARYWLGLLDDPIIDEGLCPPGAATRTAMTHVPAAPVLVVNQRYDYLAPRSAADGLRQRWPTAEIAVLDTGDSPSLASLCVLDLVSDFLGLPSTLGEGCT
jgi:pimeloyl-ACP methyl ester carboxylesterase